MNDQLTRLMLMLNQPLSGGVPPMRGSAKTANPSLSDIFRQNYMASQMQNRDTMDAMNARRSGTIPPFMTMYEEGDISPMTMNTTQNAYMQYLNSIATNPQASRMGTDDTMGRIRAAEELQRLKGLLSQ